jgi:aspartate/methionine/tyrosine aminotransferase
MSSYRFAASLSRLGSEGAFEVLARARALEAQGRKIIHLQIGEPDFDTPDNIKRAAIQALHEGDTHYAPAAGTAETREAIAEYVARTRGIPVEPAEVVVTPGAKPVMVFLLLAVLEPGDEVLCPNPAYPLYESIASWIGAKPVPLPLREANQFRVDPDELRRLVTPKTRVLVLNSPHNPCGAMLTTEDLAAIADVAARHDLLVLSDEIYSRILYEGEHASIAALDGMKARTIVVDGFSKTYAMTGWRLGYGVMPRPLADAVAKLMLNVDSCTASMVQRAGIEALRGPQDAVDAMVAEFRRRRDVVVDGLNAIDGITCVRPQGAFYVFPNVSAIDPDGRAFAEHLLQEAGVAVLAGAAFGQHGRGHLRLSYANSLDNLQEALRRIRDAAQTFRLGSA